MIVTFSSGRSQPAVLRALWIRVALSFTDGAARRALGVVLALFARTTVPLRSLRGEILGRRPQPSYIVFTKAGETLRGEWHGLLVTKDNHAKLKSLVQPSQVPGKQFDFARH